jgi:hypothetical protein
MTVAEKIRAMISARTPPNGASQKGAGMSLINAIQGIGFTLMDVGLDKMDDADRCDRGLHAGPTERHGARSLGKSSGWPTEFYSRNGLVPAMRVRREALSFKALNQAGNLDGAFARQHTRDGFACRSTCRDHQTVHHAVNLNRT